LDGRAAAVSAAEELESGIAGAAVSVPEHAVRASTLHKSIVVDMRVIDVLVTMDSSRRVLVGKGNRAVEQVERLGFVGVYAQGVATPGGWVTSVIPRVSSLGAGRSDNDPVAQVGPLARTADHYAVHYSS
jgi:hypothetical protein